MFPSTRGEGNICVSSCTYRGSLSPTGSKLSSSWEMFIHKQKKAVFKQSVLDEVTVSSSRGDLWEFYLGKGWSKIMEWLYRGLWWKYRDKSAPLCVFLAGEGQQHPWTPGEEAELQQSSEGTEGEIWLDELLDHLDKTLCFSQKGLDQMW